MKKFSNLQILISFLLIFPTIFVHSQQQVFTKVFYDNNGSVTANAMIKTPDNHFLICGHKDFSPMVLKMDSAGNIIWSKNYSESFDWFYALAPTHDSCFLVGGGGMFITKITLSGDTLWSKVIDFDGYYNDAVSVLETFDHGTIISGYIFQTSPSYHYKIAVAKLDSLNNLEWTKAFAGVDINSLYVATTKQSPDSGFVVYGTYQTLNPYWVSNEFIMKLSPDGDILWTKSPLLTASSHIIAMDLTILNDGFLMLGSNYTGMTLIKTDFSGNFIWGKQTSMHSEAQQIPPTPKINLTSDNGYVFAGSYGMMKIDSLGNFIWSQDLFLNTIDVVETDDGGYLALGNGPLLGVMMTGTDNPQIGIIKTDSLGNSSDCVYPGNFSCNDIFLEMETISIIATLDEGILSNCFPIITDPDISVDSGCVAFIGAVKEYQSESLEISAFPNPSTGLFQISLNRQETKHFQSLEIFNMLGEIVYETKNPSIFQSCINLQSQPNGIYFLRGIFGEATVSGRVIISH